MKIERIRELANKNLELKATIEQNLKAAHKIIRAMAELGYRWAVIPMEKADQPALLADLQAEGFLAVRYDPTSIKVSW